MRDARSGSLARGRLMVAALQFGIAPLGVAAQDTLPQPPAPVHLGAPVRGSSEFLIGIGWMGYAHDAVRPDGGLVAMSFAFHLSPRLAWTLAIDCAGGAPAGASEEESFSLCTGSVGAQYEVAVSRRARPYLRASFGQAQLDWQTEAWVSDIDHRAWATLVAVGARMPIGRSGRYAVRPELGILRTDAFGPWETHRSASLGVVHRFR